MSLNAHKKAIRLDECVTTVLSAMPVVEGQAPLTGKSIISTVAVMQIVRDLSLPTSELAAVDEYWWSHHQEIVSKKISALNEIYPIHVPATMALVRELYKRRYYTAYPRTTDDLRRLLHGAEPECGADMALAMTVNLGDMYHNVTVAEILRDAVN